MLNSFQIYAIFIDEIHTIARTMTCGGQNIQIMSILFTWNIRFLQMSLETRKTYTEKLSFNTRYFLPV